MLATAATQGISTLGATALSAGIGAFGNITGSVAGGLFGANQARKNRKFQERMYNKQVEDSVKFWNMQNEYNLPSAVYQRELEGMKANGLNPLLMYGEGGVSGNIAASSPQLPSAPHGAQASPASFNTAIDFANLAYLEAQTKLATSQANLNDTTSGKVEAETVGQNIANWLNDKTKNIELAIKFRDYDTVNQLIAESRERVFNMQQYRLMDFRQLMFQNDLAIKRFHLDSYQVGQNILQGWKGLEIGRIQANAAMKSAAAAMLHATNEARLVPWQIGVMREIAKNWSFQNTFLDKTMSNRVWAQKSIASQEYWKAQAAMWQPLMIESGIDRNKSEIWLNTFRKDLMESQQLNLNMNTFMQPFNMLGGFGAPVYQDPYVRTSTLSGNGY